MCTGIEDSENVKEPNILLRTPMRGALSKKPHPLEMGSLGFRKRIFQGLKLIITRRSVSLGTPAHRALAMRAPPLVAEIALKL
jgi:hypothetical protein